MKLGILEEVKEHTDWVNSHVIAEKSTGNHHSPNHTIKKKLRICLDPKDLNEDLEREPYHTCSVDEITRVSSCPINPIKSYIFGISYKVLYFQQMSYKSYIFNKNSNFCQ